jgi:Ni,Fe-hydrogenase maturation factor
VAQWDLPQVCAITATQLTPEMASAIAQVDNVVFVDAALKPIKPRKPQRCFGLMRLHPAWSAWGVNELSRHSGDPRALLALTQSLYGCCPRAWLITIPGSNFELGESLSPPTQLGVSQALAHIRSLVKRRRQFVC